MFVSVTIGEHHVLLTTQSTALAEYINDTFGVLRSSVSNEKLPDLSVEIFEGYGSAFRNYDVAVLTGQKTITYERADYKIVALSDFSSAWVYVFNDFALKHALITLYSSFIVHREWGLLIHSSCLLDGNGAYLFAGPSGAGKSTVARLSYPRPILSDEAAIVKIANDGAAVFNSPFRSDTRLPVLHTAIPLQAIHLLRQSTRNHRSKIGKLDGMLELVNRVFLWPHHAEAAQKTMRMCRELVSSVPVYELHFQKNQSFWEEIGSDDAI